MTDMLRKKTILVIEDDPFIAMNLEDAFTDSGFEVIGPFAAVEAGLKAINKKKPDVATLDYNLGRETSIPIARTLHAYDVPYIFLSGQVERVVIDNDLPICPVVSKPFVPEQLMRVIHEII